MRIPSGSTDRYIYFVAVDSTDLKTREQTLTSFTVYGSRNGGTAAVFTTPTVNETDTTNMPGVYELLLDEQTTLTAGNDTEELCLHITQAAMAPVTRTVEIYRPETTEGNTLDVTSTGAAGIDWANVENQGTSVSLTSTTVSTVTTAATATNLTNAPTNGDLTATMKTSINTEVDTALSDIGLDHLIQTALPTNWATDVASGSVFDNIADDGTAAYDRTTDSLQATRDHIGNGTNLTEAGGTGDHLSAIPEVTADMVKISGTAAAADQLELSAQTILNGSCEGTPTTTVIQTDLSETTDDALIGRTVIFTSGNATNEATDITDYVGSTGTLTVSALAQAPAAADTFVIL